MWSVVIVRLQLPEIHTGCSNKDWNSVTNSKSSLLWINIVIPDFKSHNIIKSARVYFMKTVNVSARWTVKTDKFTLFVYCNFLLLLSTSVCSQKINKQIVNIADINLTDYNFLSRYHYTKLKNYLKRWYLIHHWIPMFIGTPSHPVHIRYKMLFLQVCFVIMRNFDWWQKIYRSVIGRKSMFFQGLFFFRHRMHLSMESVNNNDVIFYLQNLIIITIVLK